MEVKTSIFWNFVKVFWKNKIFITVSCLIIFIGAFIVTSLMPKTYKASLTFVVFKEETGINISSIIGELPFKLGGIGTTEIDKYIAYLKSRRIRDVVIQEFDLWKEYDVEYIEELYMALDRNVEIIDNLDGTVTINCYFRRFPEKAARMAQLFYDELYNLVLELNRQKSREFREYLEENYEENQNRLAQFEDSLKEFQLKNKIIEIDVQTKFSFDALAKLIAEDQQFKLQIEYLKKFGTSKNEKLKEFQIKHKIIQKNIDKIMKEGENYVLALNELPTQGLQYYRLLRNVSIQQKIMEILLPILENARMEEQKKTANLQLLDPPFVPQYKARPKRLRYMLLLTFLLFTIEMLIFGIKESFRNSKDEIKTWLNQ